MSLTMTVEEREAFLGEARNAVLSIAEEDGGTIASPVWYLYEPGGLITIHLNDPSRKLTALERVGRATLTIQDEGDVRGDGSPLRYVSVTGPVVENRVFDRGLDGDEVWDVILRYLGEDIGRRYVALGGEAYLVGAEGPGLPRVIRVRPERWFTRDYGHGGERWQALVGQAGGVTQDPSAPSDRPADET